MTEHRRTQHAGVDIQHLLKIREQYRQLVEHARVVKAASPTTQASVSAGLSVSGAPPNVSRAHANRAAPIEFSPLAPHHTLPAPKLLSRAERRAIHHPRPPRARGQSDADVSAPQTEWEEEEEEEGLGIDSAGGGTAPAMRPPSVTEPVGLVTRPFSSIVVIMCSELYSDNRKQAVSAVNLYAVTATSLGGN